MAAYAVAGAQLQRVRMRPFSSPRLHLQPRPSCPPLRTVTVRASSTPDPYEGLFRSKVFQNELVVKEFDKCVSNWTTCAAGPPEQHPACSSCSSLIHAQDAHLMISSS
jgi:hypothetical protein